MYCVSSDDRWFKIIFHIKCTGRELILCLHVICFLSWWLIQNNFPHNAQTICISIFSLVCGDQNMRNDGTKCRTVNWSFWLNQTCTLVFQLLISSPYCLTIPQYEYEEWKNQMLALINSPKPLLGFRKPSLSNQNILPLSSVPLKRVSAISAWWFVIQNVQLKSCAHNPSFMKVFLKCNVAVESTG